jgi:hypothetical protein
MKLPASISEELQSLPYIYCLTLAVGGLRITFLIPAAVVQLLASGDPFAFAIPDRIPFGQIARDWVILPR